MPPGPLIRTPTNLLSKYQKRILGIATELEDLPYISRQGHESYDFRDFVDDTGLAVRWLIPRIVVERIVEWKARSVGESPLLLVWLIGGCIGLKHQKSSFSHDARH